MKHVFWILSVTLVLFAPMPLAAGDPLINLRSFFEDLFRVQLDGPETIMRRTRRGEANAPPDDLDERRALWPVDRRSFDGAFSCDDVEILGYADWLEGRERAQEARANAPKNLVTVDMIWPSFWSFNSPALASIDVRRTLFGNLRSASVHVAVLGHDFEISDVLDLEAARIDAGALDLLSQVRGRNYAGMFHTQMSDMDVTLVSTETCDDFTIYRIEVG